MNITSRIAILVGLATMSLAAAAPSASATTAPPPSGPPTTAPPTTAPPPASAEPAPAAPAPTTTQPSATSVPPALAPTTTEPPIVAVESAAEAAPPSTEPELSYGVTVAAACVDAVPVVDVTSTGTGSVRVTVTPASRTLTAADPAWQAPWPVSGGALLPTASWDAVRDLSLEPFDSGAVTLPANCVEPTPTAPTAPSTLTAAAGNGSIVLSWLPPSSDGGTAVTDYVVQRSADGTSGWVTIDDGVSTATTSTVGGLTNGTAVHFRVLARNVAGDSAPSNTASGVPRTVPTAPRTVTALPTNASGQVRLSWLAPSTTGGAAITDYVVQRSATGTSGWTTVNDGVSAATAYTVTGLVDGTRVHFRILARNVVGDSPPSATANAVPRTRPSAPRTLTAAPAGTGAIRLAWLAPSSTGGAAVTDYLIQRSPNGTSGWVAVSDGVGTTTTFTVTGLANGTRYYFRVLARNAGGYSPSSVVVNAIPRAVPSAVRSLTAAPTNRSGQVRLAWLAPSSTGGAAVTDYLIQRSPNGTSGWVAVSDGVGTTTTFTVIGLANGTRYYFRVLARNAGGYSPSSVVVNAIPRAVPSAVRSLTAAPTNRSGQVRLAWLAPSSTGGAAVTDYLIQRSPNGTSGWVAVSDGVGTTTTFTVIGLANGTRYYFRVLARNAGGYSPSSVVVNAIPRTVPGAPVGLRAYAAYEGYLLVWTAPASGGSAITDYVVQVYEPDYSSPGVGAWVTYSDGVSTQTDAVLSRPGYGCDDLRVAARNAAGTGPYSTITSCFLE